MARDLATASSIWVALEAWISDSVREGASKSVMSMPRGEDCIIWGPICMSPNNESTSLKPEIRFRSRVNSEYTLRIPTPGKIRYNRLQYPGPLRGSATNLLLSPSPLLLVSHEANSSGICASSLVLLQVVEGVASNVNICCRRCRLDNGRGWEQEARTNIVITTGNHIVYMSWEIDQSCTKSKARTTCIFNYNK